MVLSKRLKKTVLALFVLVIPSVCYMLLRTGTNFYERLPVYSPEGKTELTDDFPDSAAFKFDLSRFISPAEEVPELTGKMYIAGFWRERVSPEAETLAVNAVRLARIYQDLESLQFIAFIATDSTAARDQGPGPEQAAAQVQARESGQAPESAQASKSAFETMLIGYTGEEGNWLRLHIPETSAEKMMREGFLLEPEGHRGSGTPMSETLVLMDSHQRIRGYYDGSSYFDTDTLEDEITVLWKEEMNQDDQE